MITRDPAEKNDTTIRVVVDATSRISYSSFYIKGLIGLFGKKRVSFSTRYFKELRRQNESNAYDHYMAFVIIGPEERTRKFIIDFRDKPSVKENAYRWCDKYAKINFNKAKTNIKFHEKMVPIAPGFGINIWNIWSTVYYCVHNYFLCKFSPIVTFKEYVFDYHLQYRRPKLDAYIGDGPSYIQRIQGKPYVFMIGTLWQQQGCIEGTNLFRKEFVTTCKDSDCIFEGGFYAPVDHPQYEEFRELIFTEPYSVDDYIEKTKLSSIVFNTPAVHDCHGWKLGEYLAMGKAIISTPISNELPEKLVHDENIYIVSNEEELKRAVPLLLNDDDRRRRLQTGAKRYYREYVCPEKVLSGLLQAETIAVTPGC